MVAIASLNLTECEGRRNRHSLETKGVPYPKAEQKEQAQGRAKGKPSGRGKGLPKIGKGFPLRALESAESEGRPRKGKKMKVLIACEESQEVCKAFREKGHIAYSCDIKNCSGGHPEWHIKGNVLEHINPVKFMPPDEFYFTYGIPFVTEDGKYREIRGKWDLIIAHPPCTFLTKASTARLYKNGSLNQERLKKGKEAAKFFMKIYNADCERICIENPVPLKIFNLPEYSQIIQPYNFGENWKKATCLWLKNLPPLIEECHVKNTKKIPSWTMNTRSATIRAKTFPGIARAMAQQWNF